MTEPSTPEQATKAMSKRKAKHQRTNQEFVDHIREKKTNPYLDNLEAKSKEEAGIINIKNPKSKGIVPKDSIVSLRKKVESLTGTIRSQGVEIRSLKASVGSYKGANTNHRVEIVKLKSTIKTAERKINIRDLQIMACEDQISKHEEKSYDNEYVADLQDKLSASKNRTMVLYALSGLLLTVIIVGGIANGMGWI